jgi:Cysteine-rich CPCC
MANSGFSADNPCPQTRNFSYTDTLAVSLRDNLEMKEQEHYYVNFNKRRDYFEKNFALKIGKQRTDVKSEEILKNSCPVCGYLTLDERDSFDICAICYWEDDGIDDFEVNNDSGPNHMTLKEGREIFQEAKRKLLTATEGEDNLIDTLKNKFLNLDNSIELENLDKSEIVRLQNEIVDLLTKNKVYGLEKLFDK